MTRDQARYRGYRTVDIAHVCPKCREPCQALVSPVRRVPVAIFCSSCEWEQEATPKPWTPTSKHLANETRAIMKEIRSNE